MKEIKAFRIKINKDGVDILEKWPATVDAVVGSLHLLEEGMSLCIRLESGQYSVEK